MPMVRSQLVPADAGFSLALHGGAGGRIRELAREEEASFREGLAAAYAAGAEILRSGGSALDAVCATVVALEDNPLFNAGRGAALTLAGTAELDASVMTGDGQCGAVACVRHTKNPIRLARHIMEASPHVLIVDPPQDMPREAGLETVTNDYFVTEARQAQLARVIADLEAAPKSGTVGAVARDSSGGLAAATSTGGISKQWAGRVGDTPVIGAGTYARGGAGGPGVAISCTGDGEAFLAGCVAHDVWARMAYAGAGLADAAEATFGAELDPRDATGGLVAVAADGSLLLAHNSRMMFAAYGQGDEVVTWA